MILVVENKTKENDQSSFDNKNLIRYLSFGVNSLRFLPSV